jgi:predicted O-methyltransferase YrrM
MPSFYKNIQGWSDFVYVYQRMVDRFPAGSVFVEVGVWKGCSAIYMGEAIRESGKAIEFWAVDHFKGSPEHIAREPGTCEKLLQIVESNVEAAGLDDYVNVLVAPSIEAAKTFLDGSLDFAYIDAAHEYDAVYADIRAWWPKIKQGGVMAGHDYSRRGPGVIKAVDEFCNEHGLALIVDGASWIIEKI